MHSSFKHTVSLAALLLQNVNKEISSFNHLNHESCYLQAIKLKLALWTTALPTEPQTQRWSLCFAFPAIQTALRLHGEGKSSFHHELKLKRRVQREHSHRERSRSARSSCSSRSSRSSQSDDSHIHEVDKMEKEKDRQDLEIESIIQVKAVGLIGGGKWHNNICLYFVTYMCFAACTGIGNQTKGGRGEREEKTEGGADGAGETA